MENGVVYTSKEDSKRRHLREKKKKKTKKTKKKKKKTTRHALLWRERKKSCLSNTDNSRRESNIECIKIECIREYSKGGREHRCDAKVEAKIAQI